MKFKNSILECIGNTPIIKLNKIVPDGYADVFIKAEFLNPGGSIKDRMVNYILSSAIDKGEVKDMVVENTSGNTGFAVAMVSAVNGVKCVLTMPDKMSLEKVNMCRGMGAEVVITPTNVPAESPESYYETAKRIHRENDGSYYLNQYHNKKNIEAHYELTGREIWEQTEGDFDCLVAGLGTGGTMTGIAKFIKEKKSSIKTVGVDPIGSVYADMFKTGKPGKPNVYKVEGIGEDMVCGALEFDNIDEIEQVNDQESFKAARDMARKEGLFVGGSTGSAVAVALRLAKRLGKGKKVLVVAPDSGTRYMTKFYSDNWMVDYDFMKPPGLEKTISDLVSRKKKVLYTARLSETLKTVIARMKEFGISQMPVLDENSKLLGSVLHTDITDLLLAGNVNLEHTVSDLVNRDFRSFSSKDSFTELSEHLKKAEFAYIVENDDLKAVITRIDLIDYLSQGLRAE